ncbi:MAG: hypothetical protein RBS77_05715 [Candidatus Moranbacteria bacterium]|nr:hypothetical protein [Candidatus Moranbacteria bacterium]
MRMRAKTTMKINFLIKMIMIVLFVLGAFVFFVDISKAAYPWVNDPASCNAVRGSVDCRGGGDENKICGLSEGSGSCYSPMTKAEFSPDFTQTSTTRYDPNNTGGHVLNCEATGGTLAPFCNNNNNSTSNNLWCNVDDSCLNTNNIATRCFAGTWSGEVGAFECATTTAHALGEPATANCRSGYRSCDGNVSDCEIQTNVTPCNDFISGLPGVVGADCSCIVAPVSFQTGVEARFATSSPLLWGTQYGDGDLLRLSKNDISTSTFTISNSGQVGIGLTSISNDVAFEVSSTDRGVLLSRLTTAQRDGIPTPSNGLLIYNINTYQFEYFNGFTWRSIDTTSTYSALSNGGLSLNSNNEFSVNFDELTLTTSSGKLAINYDSDIFKTNVLGGLSLKYDGDFFSIDSITGLMFIYDPAFFASSTDGMRLVEMGNVVSSTYGNSTTAVTLSIDNYGRITFVGTSTIMVDINNIINSSSLARVDMENTFASPTIFSASTTFNATTTHNAGVRANLYCDSTGTNCFDPSLGWVVPITDVTTTIMVTSGLFSYNGKTGYQAANEICNDTFSGYHFCFSGEIISFIRLNGVAKFTGLPQAWIA